jgi:hypothetical protein
MAYTTQGDLRKRMGSCGEGYDPDTLNSLIDMASNFIEWVTGWWFEARDLVIDIDGRGTDILQVPVPIISISQIQAVDPSYTPGTEDIDLESVLVYNRHLTQNLTNPDDRKNPKIAFVMSSLSSHPFQIYNWPHGHQNIRLTGRFGYTEYDPTSARSIATDAGDSITAPDTIHMENGAFTQEDVGKTITVSGSASNDGTYTVATVTDTKNITVEEQTLTTEGDGFAAAMSALPQWGRTPLAIKDVCERLAMRDMPSVPGGSTGGPHDPAWYERWMRSRGKVTQEKVRDQSISYSALGSGGGGGNESGIITGDPYIDMVLLAHSRPAAMRAV